MNIGVIGYGTVGKAVAQGFRRKRHKVYVNDVKPIQERNFDKTYLINSCDFVYVCVGTPTQENGSINLSAIQAVFDELDCSQWQWCRNPIIIIKSTVIPGTTLKLQHDYPSLRLACNPEFLCEKSAFKDFLNPDRVVIGALDPLIQHDLALLYADWFCPKIFTDPTTAETIKYLSNTFLIAKVAFACEAAQVCANLGVDPKTVMDAVCLDHRINSSHLDPTLGPVPFNSPCLPKDLVALIKHLEAQGYTSELLEAVRRTGIK